MFVAPFLPREEEKVRSYIPVSILWKILGHSLAAGIKGGKQMFDVLKGILVRYWEAKRVHSEKVALLIAEHSREIFSDPDAPIAGNPEGDVTITHFLDYR